MRSIGGAHNLRSDLTARPTCPLEPLRAQAPAHAHKPWSQPLGAGTHVVLESLGLASSAHTPLCGRAPHQYKVPEHAGGGRDGFHAPPHPVSPSKAHPHRLTRTTTRNARSPGLPQRNVLLPSDLQERKEGKALTAQPCLTPSSQEATARSAWEHWARKPVGQGRGARRGQLGEKPSGEAGGSDPQMDGQMPGGPICRPSPSPSPHPSRA